MKFTIEREGPGLARAGRIETAHGVINTPAFVVVGTQATVKSLTPEMVAGTGAEVVLANTYHLYLQPGPELVAKAGGFAKMMNWGGPTMTDSGGFQVFSLGAAYGQSVSKVASAGHDEGIGEFLSASEPVSRRVKMQKFEQPPESLVKIDDDGVEFRSHLDGSKHCLTPERSMQIQHALGADIMFAFDECTSPNASHEYQKAALARTHAWAERSLEAHRGSEQALFGVVQGGRHKDLREESARAIGTMDFAGFGIGGSFTKDDIGTAVAWVNTILPKDKPRHLLGIGEPDDMRAAIAAGVDTFDCVIPTRMARHATLLTAAGRLNILNAQYREDFTPIEADCPCYTCKNYTRAYLAHLFRAKEMLAGTLASIHNIYYLVNFVKKLREQILNGTFRA